MAEPKVFLNFRNGDGQHAAAHVYSALTSRFDKEQIFRSSESIEIGEDYIERLSSAPSECAVLLAFIGPYWIDIRGARGERRIMEPEDWVRREIAAAFAAGRAVVPVLLDGTPMPAKDRLPEDIAKLPDRQGVRFDARDTQGGIETLIRKLGEVLPELRSDNGESGAAVQRITASGNSIVLAPNRGDNKFKTISPIDPRALPGSERT